MRIGLALPHYDYSFPDRAPLSWEALRDSALRAESLGFHSAWISDHFFANLARYGGPDGLIGSVEPFTALAALAGLTERIRLGTLVACAPFRHPAHVAKMATSIDLASKGRFDLGLGAGWYRDEFEAFAYDFGSTGARFSFLEESVAIVRQLFDEGPVDFQSGRFQLAGAYNRPRPAQAGGPPIWIGGKGGDRQFRLVARHAAGWNSVWRWSPAAYAERVEALRRVARAEGRDPETVRLSVGLYALVGEDEGDLTARFRRLQAWAPGGALDGVSLGDYAIDTLTGTPEACVERLAQFQAIGVEEVIVSAASIPFAVFDWSMVDLIAGALIPEALRL
jgi:probable F420-dependent oxidoreductase